MEVNKNLFDLSCFKNSQNSDFPEDTLFHSISFLDNQDSFYELKDDYDFAIFFIGKDQSYSHSFLEIRKKLYSLFLVNETFNEKIIDLGDVICEVTSPKGKSKLRWIFNHLTEQNIKPIYLSYSSYTLPLEFEALSKYSKKINLSILSPKLDYSFDEDISSLNLIFSELQSKLGRVNLLGTQEYYLSPKQNEFIGNNFFCHYGIGELKENLLISEPALRQSDMIHFDLSTISKEYFSSLKEPQVIGFNGIEASKLAWYSGISQSRSFGLNGFEQNQKIKNHEAQLVSQIFFHYISALPKRNLDNPHKNSDSFEKYTILIDGSELVFYKNIDSERWWMVYNHEKTKILIACLESVYKEAISGEIPNIWMKLSQIY